VSAHSRSARRPPCSTPSSSSRADATVRTLATLFRRHPVWVAAAHGVDVRAESAVFFTHLPGLPWRLVRRRGRTLLLRGRARDPDLVFRFTPRAVARLAVVRGGVGDFAVELFARIVERRRTERVDLRVAAPFARLVERGYVGLLLGAGPRVAAWALAHGVTTLAELRSLVERSRRKRPASWERVRAPRRPARSR
jgi:hypothetical protein